MTTPTFTDLSDLIFQAIGHISPDWRLALVVTALLSMAVTGLFIVILLYRRARAPGRDGGFDSLFEITPTSVRETTSPPVDTAEQVYREPAIELPFAGRPITLASPRRLASDESFVAALNYAAAAMRSGHGHWDVRLLLDAPRHLVRAFFKGLSYQSSIELLASLDRRWCANILERLQLNPAVRRQLEADIARFGQK